MPRHSRLFASSSLVRPSAGQGFLERPYWGNGDTGKRVQGRSPRSSAFSSLRPYPRLCRVILSEAKYLLFAKAKGKDSSPRLIMTGRITAKRAPVHRLGSSFPVTPRSARGRSAFALRLSNRSPPAGVACALKGLRAPTVAAHRLGSSFPVNRWGNFPNIFRAQRLTKRAACCTMNQISTKPYLQERAMGSYNVANIIIVSFTERFISSVIFACNYIAYDCP